MANKRIKKDTKLVAKVVTENPKPCAFCHRQVDDEINFGKLYVIGDIQCHYFCALLSCCLVQRGPENHGLFGFMYPDILAELERCKKHRCSYCSQVGASIGCCVSACRKQFHLPCGRQRDAVSLFYGTFKSFCRIHAPKQKIPDHIMSKARPRMKQEKRVLKEPNIIANIETDKAAEDMVCVICYEAVEGYPSLNTFWPPCCARDAWLHRTCLQRMALSAGMHYLKCPLCNNKNTFYESVISQGYYVPDRDAAWELEQNAFSEIYERPLVCSAEKCLCPMGRKHDEENGPWDIKLCLLCGSVGRHTHCTSETFVCDTCKPVAPADLDALANHIENIIQREQSRSASNRRGPVMPSRMSLRRTKRREASLTKPSCSRENQTTQSEAGNTVASRLVLNIKTPRKPASPLKKSKPDNDLTSPNKIINGLQENGLNLDEKAVEKIRRKILKPRPLSVKRRIVSETLKGLLKDKSPLKEKQKDPVKEWRSPKKDDIENNHPETEVSIPNKIKTPTKTKTPQKSEEENEKEAILDDHDESSNSTFELPPEFIADVHSDDSFLETPKTTTIDIKQDSSLEIFKKDEVVTIDMIKVEKPSLRYDKIFNFSPLGHDCKKMDVENFKKEYLNEVGKKIECPKVGMSEEKKSVNCQSDVENGGKRKRCHSETNIGYVEKKKRRTSDTALLLQFPAEPIKINKEKSKKIKIRKKKNKKDKSKKQKRLKVIFDSVETKKHETKVKTKLSINNRNIKLKIQWKQERLHLKLESKKKIKKDAPKLKQYILHCPNEGPSKEVLIKPEKDVKALKRKYNKLEKSPDKFKQTSLHSFFKLKASDNVN